MLLGIQLIAEYFISYLIFMYILLSKSYCHFYETELRFCIVLYILKFINISHILINLDLTSIDIYFFKRTFTPNLPKSVIILLSYVLVFCNNLNVTK